MYATELKGHAQQFPGWQATAAYVFPFDSPDTRMDSESAERFLNLLRAKDRDALKTVASRLRYQLLVCETFLLDFVLVSDCASLTKVFTTWGPAGSSAEWGLVLMSYVLASKTEIEP